MLDKNRIASKFAELSGFLKELDQVAPKNYADYQTIEKKRSCERLMQLSIECVVDVCKLLVSGENLGMPGKEQDILDALEKKKIISTKLTAELKKMRGFRNILVHEYATVDDELAFEIIKTRAAAFTEFKKEITSFIKANNGH